MYVRKLANLSLLVVIVGGTSIADDDDVVDDNVGGDGVGGDDVNDDDGGDDDDGDDVVGSILWYGLL